MNAYKIFYSDEFENPLAIEIVAEGSLLKYVNEMIQDERIRDDTMELFNENHPYGLQTETDAMEILEIDGYSVQKIKIFQ